jgi:hypothetical protein
MERKERERKGQHGTQLRERGVWSGAAEAPAVLDGMRVRRAAVPMSAWVQPVGRLVWGRPD